MMLKDISKINIGMTKNEFYFIVTYCVLIVTYYIWTWSPILAQFGGDNATYFLTANSFSPYGKSFFVSEYFSSKSLYPPLYPILLGLLGGGNSILIAHLITTTFLLIAILILYQWILLLNHEKLHATVLVIVFSILPGTYFQALSIHSENIYLLFSLLAIFFVTLKETSGNHKFLLLAAIFIACSTLSRSAGFTLALAFIFYLVINNSKRKYLLSFIAIFPMVLWSVFNNQSDSSYISVFSNHYSGNYITIFIQQISNQSLYILHAWYSSFTPGTFGQLLLAIIFVASLLSALYRTLKKKLDGIYIILYLLMILVWPYPAESMRLLYPVIPILLVQTSICIKDITDQWVSDNIFLKGNYVLEAILLIILIPNLILTINRFNITVDENLIPYKRTNAWYETDLNMAMKNINIFYGIFTSLNDVKQYVPNEECVYSIKPTIIELYMQRISKVPPRTIIDDDFYRSIEQSNCRYFYFIETISPSYKIGFYPLERIEDNIDVIKAYKIFYNNQSYLVSVLGKLKG